VIDPAVFINGDADWRHIGAPAQFVAKPDLEPLAQECLNRGEDRIPDCFKI
jgi:hypothetical protein